MKQVESTSDAFDRPIIILGAPRSGTTFLGDVLAAHRDVAYAIEPTPIWRYGNESHSDCLHPKQLTGRIRHHIRSRFQEFLRASGKTRLVEKTPQNSLRPEFVDAAIPEARYVHIIRHGYESSLSIRSHWTTNTRGFRGVRPGQRLKELSPSQIPRYGWQAALRTLGSLTGLGTVLWGPKLPGMRQMLAELDILEIAALQWRWCVERTCVFGRSLPDHRYLEFKLEEMDVDSFGKITDFCEMGDDPAVSKAFHQTFKRHEASYRAGKADSSEINFLRGCLEPTLRWLEYPI